MISHWSSISLLTFAVRLSGLIYYAQFLLVNTLGRSVLLIAIVAIVLPLLLLIGLSNVALSFSFFLSLLLSVLI